MQNGVATLKGPVRTAEEKAAKETKAAAVVGQDRVVVWIRSTLPNCRRIRAGEFLIDAALQANCHGPPLRLTFTAIQPSHFVARRSKENYMAEDIKKDQGQSPGQSGQQPGQPQQQDDDVSKKNPAQDRNQQQDDKQKQQDQGGQRRAS